MDNLEYFTRSSALLEGHFQLTSGLHSSSYFQCALVLQFPEYCGALCGQIAGAFRGLEVQRVIAPAVGGIVVASEVGRLLELPSCFAERVEGRMTLRRGFELKSGERVLVVEDVVTTGGSVREVAELVRAAGAEVAGVGVIVDRSGDAFGIDGPGGSQPAAGESDGRFFACHTQQVETWTPDNCPLCREGRPIDRPGSRTLS